jgi:hypothetical protein
MTHPIDVFRLRLLHNRDHMRRQQADDLTPGFPKYRKSQCYGCKYWTGDALLKCAVYPTGQIDDCGDREGL